jgi:signal transduction histidine kinase
VAGLAHEIGTPLNSILVISQEMESSVGEQQKKELGIIANQAKRIGEIVSLLLGYSRTFVRKGEDVKYTPLTLRPWIEDTYRLLVQAESKRYPGERTEVDFRIHIHDLPETVSVPVLVLRQVLENLLKNARDALRNTPNPQIELEVYPDDQEDELVFVISDNGPGFEKEEQEKAFEAFFSTKDPGVGSGLGLYISYYLLTQVGGRIAIVDHSGPGAKMLVALPRLDELDDQA